MKLERVICPVCGRGVAGRNPAGGDGSGLRLSRHDMGLGACSAGGRVYECAILPAAGVDSERATEAFPALEDATDRMFSGLTDNASIPESLRKDLEAAVMARVTARNAELQRLTIGILSGEEGATNAMLVYDADGTPHGLYGVDEPPYTITELLPLWGAGAAVPGNLPRVVHMIPQRWAMELSTGDVLPINMHDAARYIQDGTAEVVCVDLTGVVHLRSTITPPSSD